MRSDHRRQHPEPVAPKNRGLRITGTFLDEISHDIPRQNRGEREWGADFADMKCIGSVTVIMIRSGCRKLIAYPARAGYGKAIAFEFSHFLSPQTRYAPAHRLSDRYNEYFTEK